MISLEKKIAQIEKGMSRTDDRVDLSHVPDHLLRRYVCLTENEPESPEFFDVIEKMSKYIS